MVLVQKRGCVENYLGGGIPRYLWWSRPPSRADTFRPSLTSQPHLILDLHSLTYALVISSLPYSLSFLILIFIVLDPAEPVSRSGFLHGPPVRSRTSGNPYLTEPMPSPTNLEPSESLS